MLDNSAISQKHKAEWQNQSLALGRDMAISNWHNLRTNFQGIFTHHFLRFTPAKTISGKIVTFYTKISFLSTPTNRATTVHGCPDCALPEDAWSTGWQQAEIQQCHSSHAVSPGLSFMRQGKVKALISNFSKDKIDTICADFCQYNPTKTIPESLRAYMKTETHEVN